MVRLLQNTHHLVTSVCCFADDDWNVKRFKKHVRTEPLFNLLFGDVFLGVVNINVICLATEHQGVYKNSFRNVRAFQDRIGIWKCWFLRRGENRSTRRKTSPRGAFLERPGNLTGRKSYFEVKVSRKVGCVLTWNITRTTDVQQPYT